MSISSSSRRGLQLCGRFRVPAYRPAGVGGFSILELLVALVIMSILLALSVPSVAKSRNSIAPGAAADRFVHAHGLARATASRYGQMAEFHIEPDSGRFWVSVDRPGGIRDTLTMVRELPGVAMSSTRNLVCFEPRGLATSAGACESGDLEAVFSTVEGADTITTNTLGIVFR